nr:MAG TPA: hypothetical protein [Caudoviricetes sp.]
MRKVFFNFRGIPSLSISYIGVFPFPKQAIIIG